MGKRYTVCTVQIRKMPVPERYMHVYWDRLGKVIHKVREGKAASDTYICGH